MGLFDPKSGAEAMEDLLERERQAILDGRFDLLDRLIAQKDRHLNGLKPKEMDEKDLNRLRQMGERNARLLDAMREGIVAVQHRLAALQGPGAALETYEADGRRNTFLPTKTTDTRRA